MAFKIGICLQLQLLIAISKKPDHEAILYIIDGSEASDIHLLLGTFNFFRRLSKEYEAQGRYFSKETRRQGLLQYNLVLSTGLIK